MKGLSCWFFCCCYGFLINFEINYVTLCNLIIIFVAVAAECLVVVNASQTRRPFSQKTGRSGGRQINEQWEMRTGIRKRWGKTTAARIPVLLLLLQVERTHRGKRFRFRFRLFDSFRYFISEGELCCTGKIAINRRGKNIIKSGCERLKNSKILTLSGLRSYTNIVDVDFQLSFMGKNGQDFL